jgi:hypothetical protein
MRTASANARKTTPLSSLTRAAEDVGASLLRAQRPVVVQEGRLISARKATRGKGRRNGARQRRQSTCEQCLHPQNHGRQLQPRVKTRCGNTWYKGGCMAAFFLAVICPFSITVVTLLPFKDFVDLGPPTSKALDGPWGLRKQ